MKFIVFLAAALAVLCLIQAQPVPVEPGTEILAQEPLETFHKEVQEHSRQKRATCDLLSKWNWNHTACAAHCITKRYKGGYCNDKAVCVCRN